MNTKIKKNRDWPTLYVGDVEYKGNSMLEKLQYEAMLTQLVKHTFPNNPTVAMLGAGTFYFQSRINLKKWSKQDVYEINPDVQSICLTDDFIQPFTVGWDWFMGDWHDTLEKKYDLLVYECDEDPVDLERLEQHLNPGGLLLVYFMTWRWLP